MFHRNQVKNLHFLVQLTALLQLAAISLPCLHEVECLIITSVIAGDKKFKTISFDSKFIKPLMFESELPTTEFRRHRTMRPPKFDIDVNIPIKLPLEDQYAPPEYKKPVVSNIAFETGEIVEPKYGANKKQYYNKKTPHYPTKQIKFKESLHDAASNRQYQKVLPAPKQVGATAALVQRRTDAAVQAAPGASTDQYMRRNSYGGGYQQEYQQDFVPGGFVNLQLSGPTGGPKMTYEDFDREKWAQQLSQTAGAMPYPILNYHQLQNFYGGLGTFTNGLAESRYTYVGPLEKLKRMLLSFKG